MTKTKTNTSDTTLKKYAVRTEQYKMLLEKYAELEKEMDGMKEEVETAKKETEETKAASEEAVQKAVAAVKKGASAAVTPAETDAVSDAAKNALVDAVSRIDSEAGDTLAEAVDAAEVISGEKLAGMVLDVFKTIGANQTDTFGTLTPGRMNKSASRTVTHEDRLMAQLESMQTI